jgi:hypothetical protein
LRLLEALKAVWAGYPAETKAVPLKVDIALLDLHERSDQTRSLFDDLETCDRLNAAVDRLISRYGRNAVNFGGAQ